MPKTKSVEKRVKAQKEAKADTKQPERDKDAGIMPEEC